MTMEDTVISIERGPMTMEAILLRDQRTTSHRVLDREQSQNVSGTMPKTKIGIKDFVVDNGNERTQIKRLLERPASSRICRSTCCARACSQCRCRRPSCRYSDDENNNNNKKKNDYDRISIQRHFRSDVSDVCQAVSSSSTDDDRGIRSRRGSSSITTTTWLRLSSLLVTLLVVSVHGAPTMTLNNRRLSVPPKWLNPCGYAIDDTEGDFDGEPVKEPMFQAQILTQILTPAENAKMHVEMFRDEYVKQTFNVDFADFHSQWKDDHYDWLPSCEEIPKQLGEKLERKYLETLEIDKALLDAYEYMQKYAVGIEQIVWDQEDYDLAFRKQFNDTELNLGSILCELQVALMERGVPLRPDVSRDIMSTEYRTISSSTYRNLRDWVIFRDYMNGLEYIVQVFEFFRSKLES